MVAVAVDSFLRSLLGAVMLAAMVLLVGTTLAQAHRDEAYSYASERKTTNQNWMRKLPDSLQPHQLSIPGTHDSMSIKGRITLAGQTQSMSLEEQLHSGIRALDIRVRRTEGDKKFAVHHGPVYLRFGFGDVLNDVQRFLAVHSGEFILMRLSEEEVEQKHKSNAGMDAVFLRYVKEYPDLFWRPGLGQTNDPTLRDLRGKILLLRAWSASGEAEQFGFRYENKGGYMSVQDQFSIKNETELYAKWKTVKSEFRWIANFYKESRCLRFDNARHCTKSVRGLDTMYVNYLSATGFGNDGRAYPYFVASGHSDARTNAPRLSTGHTNAEKGYAEGHPDFPRLDCLGKWCTIFYEGINVLANDLLGSPWIGHTGVVFMDFPGPGLIDNIVLRNFRLVFHPMPIGEPLPYRAGHLLTSRWQLRCLGAIPPNPTSLNNPRVWAIKCFPGSTWQQWTIDAVEPADGGPAAKAMVPGVIVTVRNEGLQAASEIGNGVREDTRLQIVHVSGSCLQLSRVRSTAHVELGPCPDSSSSHWRIADWTRESFHLESTVRRGYCLEDTLSMGRCDPNRASQRFSAEPGGRLRAIKRGRCLLGDLPPAGGPRADRAPPQGADFLLKGRVVLSPCIQDEIRLTFRARGKGCLAVENRDLALSACAGAENAIRFELTNDMKLRHVETGNCLQTSGSDAGTVFPRLVRCDQPGTVQWVNGQSSQVN